MLGALLIVKEQYTNQLVSALHPLMLLAHTDGHRTQGSAWLAQVTLSLLLSVATLGFKANSVNSIVRLIMRR